MDAAEVFGKHPSLGFPFARDRGRRIEDAECASTEVSLKCRCMNTHHQGSPRYIELPFGINIAVYPSGGGSLESNLVDELRNYDDPKKDALARAAADAIESLLLALACAGFDLETAACKEAIATAVESAANRL